MKKLFQLWLLVFVAGAFWLTFAGSWWLHSYLAQESAKELLRVKLTDAARQVRQSRNNLDDIMALSNASALSKARAFSYLIAHNSKILKQRQELERIRQLLDVDELHVSDPRGILIASIPQNYEGYNMADSTQSGEFMGALKDKNFALVQKPLPNGIHRKFFQYAGVARQDQPGIVQIGYGVERIEKAQDIADIQKIAATFRIGAHGGLRIMNNNLGDDRPEFFFRQKLNNVKSFCLAVPCGKYLLVGNLPESEMYLSRNSVLRILVIGNLVLFGVIFLLVSGLLQKVVIKGIYSVNDSLKEITAGNLNEQIEVNTTREFEALSHGINATVSALKKSIENEARRIDAELEMGRTIQNSVLPVDFPAHEKFQLAAAMCAAKEVGGDFYDFFMIDDRHLAVLIADVSGKGITAALYMMNSKALLKELIASGMPPAEAYAQANRELCQNNQAHMFITSFLGVLELDTGILTCVNAGHNPPLLMTPDHGVEFLRIKHSLVLGFSPKISYHEVKIPLAAGSRLLLYTDGVTEALNASNELFGEERLQHLPGIYSGTPADTITLVRNKLKDFSAGVEQSDDITLLVLDYLKAEQHA